MRQLTYVAPQRLEWWDVPSPVLGSPLAALVAPLAVARCDLDLPIVRGHYRTPGPFAFGHETVAKVVDVGDGVRDVQPGDRVIVPFQISCGLCPPCRRGWTNACEREAPCAAFGLGTHPDGDYGGAFSDLLRVPYADAMLVPLPPDLSPAAACGLGDNVADGFRTVAEPLRRLPGADVLIAGGLAQSVGLYAVLAARALGAGRVLYADPSAERRRLAQGLGADTLAVDYRDQPPVRPALPITVEASALPGGLDWLLRSTAPCGFCTAVTGGSQPVTELPLASLYLRGVTLDVSRVHGRHTLTELLPCVCDGRIDPLAIAPTTLAFDSAAEALLDDAPKQIYLR